MSKKKPIIASLDGTKRFRNKKACCQKNLKICYKQMLAVPVKDFDMAKYFYIYIL